MRPLGRFLKLLALIVLPLSMILEITGGLGRSFGLSQMVIMLVFGICSFTIGHFLEAFAGSSSR